VFGEDCGKKIGNKIKYLKRVSSKRLDPIDPGSWMDPPQGRRRPFFAWAGEGRLRSGRFRSRDVFLAERLFFEDFWELRPACPLGGAADFLLIFWGICGRPGNRFSPGGSAGREVRPAGLRQDLG
jgi:hypothetical protein